MRPLATERTSPSHASFFLFMHHPLSFYLSTAPLLAPFCAYSTFQPWSCELGLVDLKVSSIQTNLGADWQPKTGQPIHTFPAGSAPITEALSGSFPTCDMLCLPTLGKKLFPLNTSKNSTGCCQIGTLR